MVLATSFSSNDLTNHPLKFPTVVRERYPLCIMCPFLTQIKSVIIDNPRKFKLL